MKNALESKSMPKQKKNRIPVPPDVEAEILFLSNHTCCKCRELGKPVQIHHIDEDPSNNDTKNLSVLCLICHNETQVSGGFGKKLKAPEVIRYRDDWIERIKYRRDEADSIAIRIMSSAIPNAEESTVDNFIDKLQGPDDLVAYVKRTPVILKAGYLAAEPLMGGTTQDMVNGTFEVIDVTVRILVSLSHWFPENHFDDIPAEQYFSKYMSERANWCRALGNKEGYDEDGYSRVGTIGKLRTAGRLLEEMERTVESMVYALFETGCGEEAEALEAWRKEWNAAKV